MIKLLSVHAHSLTLRLLFPPPFNSHHSSPFPPSSSIIQRSLSLAVPLPHPPQPRPLSPSPHTTESRLAQSPPRSLGSACRRPTPTTSGASGWPWPRLLALSAGSVSISHAARWRWRQRPPMREPPSTSVVKGRKGGGGVYEQDGACMISWYM